MADKPIFDTAPALSPITGEAALVIESHHNWEVYHQEFSPKLNQNNEWIEEKQQQVSLDAIQVDLDKNTTVDAKNITVAARDEAIDARDEAQDIADGISTILPEGTISDGTVQDDAAWSSQKIVRQMRSHSPEIIRIDGLLSEVRYDDGSKDVLNRDANKLLSSIDYYAEDGETILYTDTLTRDENNNLTKVERS